MNAGTQAMAYGLNATATARAAAPRTGRATPSASAARMSRPGARVVRPVHRREDERRREGHDRESDRAAVGGTNAEVGQQRDRDEELEHRRVVSEWQVPEERDRAVREGGADGARGHVADAVRVEPGRHHADGVARDVGDVGGLLLDDREAERDPAQDEHDDRQPAAAASASRATSVSPIAPATATATRSNHIGCSARTRAMPRATIHGPLRPRGGSRRSRITRRTPAV